MRKIKLVIERTGTGYSAYADKYAVYSVGTNIQELKTNMVEALNLYFEESNTSVTVSEKDIKTTLDIPQFFEFYKIINAKAFSERIGMNQSLLAQYIKGIKKPSAKQSQRILDGIQQIGKELAEVSLLI